jgi:threonylcarbamoyladenosine tRNA methylthiotransferase MtaB
MILRTFRVTVLGCKVNQYEARQIGGLLEAYGLTPAPAGAGADVEVVHTCAVTGPALAKSAYQRRRAQARKSPNGVVIATGCGCAPEVTADEPSPGATAVSPGPRWLDELARTLDALPLPRIPAGGDFSAGTLRRFEGHARAFLKIQDGCDLRCRYCIVPRLRGPSRDTPLETLTREARALAEAGHAELVVTGVSVGLWGRDRGGLATALEALLDIEAVRRIRLSSLHPAEVTADLLAVWASSPRILPHLHLPLQSGSDSVLNRMNRGYDTAGFLAAVRRASAALDRPTFTTDVIAGFPGETDRDFEDTLRVCREAGVFQIHAFPFSPRPGTPAAAMDGQVSSNVIAARMKRLAALDREQESAAFRKARGEDAEILCETRRGSDWFGHSERYFPVRARFRSAHRGDILRVRLGGVEDGAIRADPR